MRSIITTLALLAASCGAYATCQPGQTGTWPNCVNPSVSAVSSESASIATSSARAGSNSDATGTGVGIGGDSSARAGGGGGATLNGGSSRALGLGLSRGTAANAPMPVGCELVVLTQSVDGYAWGARDHSEAKSDPSLCAAWKAYQEAQAQCWHLSARRIFAAFVKQSAGVEIKVDDKLTDDGCKADAKPEPVALMAPVALPPVVSHQEPKLCQALAPKKRAIVRKRHKVC